MTAFHAEPPVRHARRTFLKGTASVLLSGVAGGLSLSGCGGGGADAAATPRLASVANFRDIGGAAGGYPTIDGRFVRRGVFYRSSALTLDAVDRTTLDALAIAAVYDLRTPGEVARAADVLPVGAAYQAFNVLGTSDVAERQFDTPAEAIAAMEHAQREYVLGSAQRTAFGSLLAQLAQTAGVQLVNSSAGKDRAGWAAALLLSIANVPFDVIMQDYLLSNTYAAASIRARVDAIAAQRGSIAAAAAQPTLRVQASFLQVAFEQVHASYGTMTAYLTDGLGLTQDTIDALHGRLVI